MMSLLQLVVRFGGVLWCRQRQAKESFAKVNLVTMRSVPKRGSVGLLHELAQQFSSGPDATAFRY